MDNLIFALNSTMPIFLLMVLGALFHKLGWMDDVLADKANKLVFQILLPVKIFQDLAQIDFAEVWDLKFLFFCFSVTFGCILLAILISFVWKDASVRGEFVQASYRSSASLLGIAFISNIYGTSGMAALMVIGAVPLYNVMAVVVLTVMKPGNKGLGKDLLKKSLLGIVKNPIIISIVLGTLWSALRLPLGGIALKTVSNVGSISTPLGLMAMGASFRLSSAGKTLKPALLASFMKLMGFGIVFLPLAIALGFRQEELVAILVMLGSATTVAGYVMAKNMGHEGSLTSTTVMLTTLFSAVTLTFWLWLVKSLGMV